MSERKLECILCDSDDCNEYACITNPRIAALENEKAALQSRNTELEAKWGTIFDSRAIYSECQGTITPDTVCAVLDAVVRVAGYLEEWK